MKASPTNRNICPGSMGPSNCISTAKRRRREKVGIGTMSTASRQYGNKTASAFIGKRPRKRDGRLLFSFWKRATALFFDRKTAKPREKDLATFGCGRASAPSAQTERRFFNPTRARISAQRFRAPLSDISPGNIFRLA